MSLARIAEVTGGVIGGTTGRSPGTSRNPAHGCTDPAEVVVDGPVVTDSREARQGSLYVARIGEHADGHGYTPQAAAAGAVAALVTTPVDALPYVLVPDVQEAFAAIATHVIDSVEHLVVVGVTGSSGKTTTKDLLAAVLSTHAPTVANAGSLNSEVGVPLTVCRADAGTRFLVLEMGARGVGHIRYLTDMTHPSVGVVLNVGSAHVGEFGSQQAIATAKSELVQALPTGGMAVLNADDPLVAAMPVAAGVRVVRTSCAGAPDAQVRAHDVTLGPDGAPVFTLEIDGFRASVRLGLLGLHQVDNALAVAAVAAAAGMSCADIAAALQAARPASRWRMERHDRGDGVTILNDAYNANPESMAAALRTLAHLRDGAGARRRTWAVLGGMLELGPDSIARHHEMGVLATQLGVDEVLAVGAVARPIERGARDAAHAGDDPDVATSRVGADTRARWVDDTDAALAVLTAELREGDVVLLKSSRDSGLRHLGDELTTVHSEVDA